MSVGIPGRRRPAACLLYSDHFVLTRSIFVGMYLEYIIYIFYIGYCIPALVLTYLSTLPDKTLFKIP